MAITRRPLLAGSATIAILPSGLPATALTAEAEPVLNEVAPIRAGGLAVRSTARIVPLALLGIIATPPWLANPICTGAPVLPTANPGFSCATIWLLAGV